MAGCTTGGKSDRINLDHDYVDRYEQQLRWKRFNYLKPYFKELESYLKTEEHYKNVQIEATRILAINPLNVEGNRFKVIVERREVADASISLKTVRYIQYWDYDTLKKRWLLSDEQPISR